jgi:hypothetical protein
MARRPAVAPKLLDGSGANRLQVMIESQGFPVGLPGRAGQPCEKLNLNWMRMLECSFASRGLQEQSAASMNRNKPIRGQRASKHLF